MAKWIIDKVIGEFDYSHRVWLQELDENLSCGSQCKCRFHHGHRGKVIAYLEASELTGDSEMVIDFNDLKIMTHWIDKVLDHKCILDFNDPLFEDTFYHFLDSEGKVKDIFEEFPEGYSKVRPEIYKDMPSHFQEKYESYVMVNFAPTSENLSKWMYEVLTTKIKSAGIKVHKIEWFETPKSRATYYGD